MCNTVGCGLEAADEKAQALKELEMLFELYQKGALTEEEYTAKKKEILERI